MKTKIAGILVCMLLIATAIPAVGTMNEKEIPASLGIGGTPLNYPSIHRIIMNGDRGALFMQLPIDPAYPGNGPISDLEYGWVTYDDFWEVTGPICDIHWWGFGAFWNGTAWVPCDPEGMMFNITFYEDDAAGKPGDMVCSYVDVMPSVTPLGIYYDLVDVILELHYFDEVDLDPCCELSEGWVSIAKTYSPNDCTFGLIDSYDGNLESWQQNLISGLWYHFNYDVAFILTDGEPDIPDLECDGELSWTDVPPGATVTGDFVVRNNGDPDSILHWKVESYPNWGNWTFTPNASILTIGAGWITVDVEVIAPDDPNEEFTGEVKLVNVMDPSDSCTIDVSLATPKNKPFKFNYPLLSWLFERFPNAFPMLRHMLGL